VASALKGMSSLLGRVEDAAAPDVPEPPEGCGMPKFRSAGTQRRLAPSRVESNLVLAQSLAVSLKLHR